jgi:hypothetical protein
MLVEGMDFGSLSSHDKRIKNKMGRHNRLKI